MTDNATSVPLDAAVDNRPTPNRRGTSRLTNALVTLFVLLSVGVAFGSPLPYFTVGLERLAEDQAVALHYLEQPAAIRVALLIHAASAGLALLLTPVQASRWVRRRQAQLHRLSGRLSAAAIAVAAVSGLVIAQVSYAGWSGRIGFSMLSVIWFYGVYRLVTAARAGDLATHRRWGIRVMALTFAAVTLRLWLIGYIIVSAPASDAEFRQAFDQIYAVTPFLSWIPNLVMAEYYLRRRGPAGQGAMPTVFRNQAVPSTTVAP
jgi:uncharacterized membrane protein